MAAALPKEMLGANNRLRLGLIGCGSRGNYLLGEVFLQVKRAALAEGDGFALSLVAYGDTSWQL